MKNPPVILIVEDNPGDVRLIKETLQASATDLAMSFARDGIEAIHFLEARKREPANGFPHLMILDLHLSKKDGFEILKFVKRDETLKRIPVIVFSSSQNPNDIAKAYDLHANCYLIKSADAETFVSIVKALEYFWVRLVNLPPTSTTPWPGLPRDRETGSTPFS